MGKADFMNPFHATDLFLYPLKTSGNQRIEDVSRGYKKEISGMKWVNAMEILTFAEPVSFQKQPPEVFYKKWCF